jgi:hypothetical protein
MATYYLIFKEVYQRRRVGKASKVRSALNVETELSFA